MDYIKRELKQGQAMLLIFLLHNKLKAINKIEKNFLLNCILSYRDFDGLIETLNKSNFYIDGQDGEAIGYVRKYLDHRLYHQKENDKNTNNAVMIPEHPRTAKLRESNEWENATKKFNEIISFTFDNWFPYYDKVNTVTSTEPPAILKAASISEKVEKSKKQNLQWMLKMKHGSSFETIAGYSQVAAIQSTFDKHCYSENKIQTNDNDNNNVIVDDVERTMVQLVCGLRIILSADGEYLHFIRNTNNKKHKGKKKEKDHTITQKIIISILTSQISNIYIPTDGSPSFYIQILHDSNTSSKSSSSISTREKINSILPTSNSINKTYIKVNSATHQQQYTWVMGFLMINMNHINFSTTTSRYSNNNNVNQSNIPLFSIGKSKDAMKSRLLIEQAIRLRLTELQPIFGLAESLAIIRYNSLHNFFINLTSSHSKF